MASKQAVNSLLKNIKNYVLKGKVIKNSEPWEKYILSQFKIALNNDKSKDFNSFVNEYSTLLKSTQNYMKLAADVNAGGQEFSDEDVRKRLVNVASRVGLSLPKLYDNKNSNSSSKTKTKKLKKSIYKEL